MINNPNTDDLADAVMNVLRDILAKGSGQSSGPALPTGGDEDTLLETIKDVLAKNLPGGSSSSPNNFPQGGLSFPRRETSSPTYAENEWAELLARQTEERQEMKLRHEQEREEVRLRREQAREENRIQREQQREEARLERERQMEERRREREGQMEARRREREARQRLS